MVTNTTANQNFPILTNSPNGTAVDTTTANNYVRVIAGTTSGLYSTINRYILIFNTSNLSERNYTINGADIFIKGYTTSKGTSLGTYTIFATDVYPQKTFTQKDFANNGSYIQSKGVKSTDILNSAYVGFNLTNTSSLNTTGNSSYMMRIHSDINSTNMTWSLSGSSYFRFYTSKQTGTTSDPYLIVWVTENIGVINSSFTTNSSSIKVGSTINLTDTSSGIPTSWNYSWGDGTWTNGTSQNPEHTYFENGTYNIQLLSSNSLSSNLTPDSRWVNITVSDISSSFTSNVTGGIYPFGVQFNDTSQYNITSWNWTFGDGGSSVLQNPEHTFTSCNIYKVNLTVLGVNGVSNTSSNNITSGYTQYNSSINTLLHFNGVNGSTDVVDEFGNVWTYNPGINSSINGMYINTSNPKFGSGDLTAYKFSSTELANLSTNNASLYNPNIDWTTDFMFRGLPGSSSGSSLGIVFLQNYTANSWRFTYTSSSTQSTTFRFWYNAGGSSGSYLSDSYNVLDGNWHYISLQRTGNVLRLYVDGATGSTLTNSLSTSLNYFPSDMSLKLVALKIPSGSDSASFMYDIDEFAYFNTSIHSTSGYTPQPTEYGPVTCPSTESNAPVSIISNATSIMMNDTVQFNDTSNWVSPTSWNWSWGDGTWSNVTSDGNQTKTYSTGGKYNAYLSLTNATYTNQSPTTSISVYNYTISNFTTNLTYGLYNLPIQVNSTSINATLWNYSWGDGTWSNATTLSSSNFTHTYSSGGNYTLTLNTSDSNHGYSQKSTYIEVYNRTISGMSANITSGLYLLPVQFNLTNSDDNATFWNWSFGDNTWYNTTDITQRNTTKIYSSGGVYTITQYSGNIYYTNITTYTDYISVYNRTTSGITSNVTSGYSPLPVQFNTSSFSNGTVFNWTFGAANYSSTQNTTYTFAGAGSYDVVLNVSNGYAFNITTLNNYIIVNAPLVLPIYSNFTSNITKIQEKVDTVGFTDTSNNTPLTWNWSFGDGVISSLQNPNHTWYHFAVYNVNLTANNTNYSVIYPYIMQINVTESMKTNQSANITIGTSPLTVQFTDLSTNASIHNWTFGAANYSSLQNPIYTFNGIGSYTVVHNASSDVSYNTSTFTNWIHVITGELPVSNFTTNKTYGTEPQVVLFIDTSKGVNTTKNLSFGDGTWYNTTSWLDQSKLYSHFGNYPSYLIASNLNGTNTTEIHWLNFTESMKTNMTMNLTKIEEDKDTIQFTDLSTNASIYNWSFGDGKYSSSQNPNHTYSNFGIYTISLNASSSSSYNITTFTNQINVTEKMITNISANITKIQQKRDTVQFNDISTNASIYNWSFGDGKYSSSQNPNHTYSNFGLFTVLHNASSDVSYNATVFVNYINVTQEMITDFSSNVTSGYSPLSVQFNDTSTNATSWNWTFGGANYSSVQNPVYTFTGDGLYTVSLNASSDTSFNITTKVNYINVTTPPNILFVNFSANITKIQQNKDTVQFTELASNESAYNWSFGDNQYSILNNPNHTYKYFGLYTVSLNVSSSSLYNISTKTNYINVTEKMKTNMSANITNGPSPLSVQFTDSSTNATSWNWTFGGANYSSVQNPIYTFNGSGLYTVSLNASSDTDYNITTFNNWINVTTPPPPIVNFTYNNTGGIQSVPVQFTSDSITNILTYNWSFGDGNYSTTQNPLFVYDVPGTYSVSLNVTNTSGYNSTTKTNIITITQRVLPIVNFTSNNTGGIQSVPVQFTSDSITDILVYNWTFGGANYSSIQNPIYTFNGVGSYNVILNVTNASGYNSTTKSNYIIVTPPPILFDDFSANITKIQQNKDTVQFTELTLNESSYLWNFGDGQTSTLQNPNHTYKNFGLHTVSLTVYSPYLSNITTKTNYINVTQKMITEFTSDKITGKQNEYVQFTDLSTNATIWSWNFGDGQTSTLHNPNHRYTNFGTFTVTLNASSDTDYNTTVKTGYVTITELMITDFNGVPTSGTKPLSVTFTDLSRNATSWYWTFGDGGTSVLHNPTYIYNTGGIYTVTLSTSSATDSNSTTKNNYITVNSPPISGFSYSGNYGDAFPITVQFIDESTYTPTSWSWDFGDGNSSGLQNPTHDYYSYDEFTVTLQASNAFGSDSISKQVKILPNNPDVPIPVTLTYTNYSIPIDVRNGTYTSQIFGSAFDSGNLTIMDIAKGCAAPFEDFFVKLTGEQSSAYWLYCIVWLIILGAIYIATGKVVIPLLIGIMTASGAAIIIPSLVVPTVTIMFAICGAGIFYRLVVDR